MVPYNLIIIHRRKACDQLWLNTPGFWKLRAHNIKTVYEIKRQFSNQPLSFEYSNVVLIEVVGHYRLVL